MVVAVFLTLSVCANEQNNWQVAKINCAIWVTLCILSQENLNGIDLNQKIASSQDFIAVLTIPSLPMLRQHVPKLPGLHNEFMHIANFGTCN